MRAKYIYESLSFREDSDPIQDMGIGLKPMFNNLKSKDILIIIEPLSMNYSSINKTVIFPKGSIIYIHKVYDDYGGKKELIVTQYNNISDYKKDIAVEEIDGSSKRERMWRINYDFFKKHFRIIDPNHLKESIHEAFSEKGDPIEDMGIGQKALIKKWFETWAPYAKYTIDDELNIKVEEYLDLEGTPITSLPDNLTVGGWLDLEGTPITSLPDNLNVIGNLILRGTPITSLPDNLFVKGNLNIRGTQIKNLPKTLNNIRGKIHKDF